jgi:hypothetical protein
MPEVAKDIVMCHSEVLVELSQSFFDLRQKDQPLDCVVDRRIVWKRAQSIDNLIASNWA